MSDALPNRILLPLLGKLDQIGEAPCSLICQAMGQVQGSEIKTIEGVANEEELKLNS